MYIISVLLGCPPDWIRLQDTCYHFQEKDLKYSAAIDYCNDIGGKLFEPKDRSTNDMVFNIAKSLITGNHTNRKASFKDWVYFWIGIDDIDEEGVFKYNSDASLVTLDLWGTDEPNNGGGNRNEDCTHLRGFADSSAWNDYNCAGECEFICEKPIEVEEDTNHEIHCKVYEHERIGNLNETFELKECQSSGLNTIVRKTLIG